MSNDFKDLFGEWPPDSDAEHLRSFGDGVPEPENRVRRALHVKECKVINVYEVCYETSDPEPRTDKATFVLLRDGSGRDLRIFVLPDVAYAMHLALEDRAPERPFTHDLMKTIVERLGGRLDHITIDDLWQDTYYARITLNTSEGDLEIDCRPSDAIALALRFGAPIYVAEAVLAASYTED